MNKKSILIIDDDPELSQELAEILRAEGYHIKSVLDSAKALKILSGKVPDLIILDYGEYAAFIHRGNSVDECGMYNKLNSTRRNIGRPVRRVS